MTGTLPASRFDTLTDQTNQHSTSDDAIDAFLTTAIHTHVVFTPIFSKFLPYNFFSQPMIP